MDGHVKGRVRIAIIVAVLTLILILPSLVLAPLGAPTAGSMIGLGGLGIAFITRATNRRVALLSAVALGVASLAAANADAHPIIGVLVLCVVAVGQGITARWGWNQAFIVLPITLAFVASESVLTPPVDSAIPFAAGMTGYALLVALAVSALSQRTAPASITPTVSWERTIGYVALLVIATSITSIIALTGDWGHTGGWLIMTPFIVLEPYLGHGWRKALNRGVGTVVGLLIADGLAAVLGQGFQLTTLGYAFALGAIIASVKKWQYAIYATLLTPAVVILESVGRPVDQTGYERVVATIIGVGVALGAMALASPVYRMRARQATARGSGH